MSEILTDFRNEHDTLKDLTDEEVLRIAHYKYVNDTGFDVDIDTFAKNIGYDPTAVNPLPEPEPELNGYRNPTVRPEPTPAPQTGYGASKDIQLKKKDPTNQSMGELVIEKLARIGQAALAGTKNVIPGFKSQLGGLMQKYEIPLLTEEEFNKEGHKGEIYGFPIPVPFKSYNDYLIAHKQTTGLTNFIAQKGKELRESAKGEMKPSTQKPGSLEYYVEAGVTSTLNMSWMLLMSIYGKRPDLGLGMMLIQVEGQMYGEGRDQGLSPKEAKMYSTLQAAWEVIPSAIPLVELLSGRSVIMAGLSEGAQEVITEALQAATDKGYINMDMTWGEAIQRIKDAAIIGAGSGATLSLLIKGITPVDIESYDGNDPLKGLATEMQKEVDSVQLQEMTRQAFDDETATHIFEPKPQAPDTSVTKDSNTSVTKDSNTSVTKKPDTTATTPAIAESTSDSDKLTDVDSTPKQGAETVTKQQVSGLPIVEVPISEIKISRDIPQFKEGANAKGVVEPLGGKFERVGVAPIQIWVRGNGDKEIITGRHRLDLAKRSFEKTIPAQLHYETEGFTRDKAVALDAILNIREGQGKVKDYVEFIKGTKQTEKEANAQGILARETGRRAFTIATKGTDVLITAHRNDQLSDEAATRIAEAAPRNERLQVVGIKAINNGKSIIVAENLVKAVQSLHDGSAQTSGDMFGLDDSAMIEAEALAAKATAKQNEIQRILSAVQGAAKRPDLAAKEGINIKDPSAIRQRVIELKAEKEKWQNWHTNPALIAELKTGVKAPDVIPGGDLFINEESAKWATNYKNFNDKTKTSPISQNGKSSQDAFIYHGSPYDFKSPNMEHYGDGEGGLGYGYGLHTSSSSRSAANYAVDLPLIKVDGKEYWGNTQINEVAKSILDNGYAQTLNKAIKAVEKYPELPFPKKKLEIVKSLKDSKIEDLRRKGFIYKLTIPKEEINTYINFAEKKQDQQSHVNKMIEEDGQFDFLDDETGKDLYYKISDELGSDKEASEYLKSVGINGIKYIDDLETNYQDSGEKHYNYTVFSPEKLTAVKVDLNKDSSQNGKPTALHQKGLDMSAEARKKRAKEQGYDVDNIIYSGTNGEPATNIRPYGEDLSTTENNLFGGIFGSFDKEVAGSHGKNIQAFYVKNHISHDDFKYAVFYDDETNIQATELFKNILTEHKNYNDNVTDEELAELLDYAMEEKHIESDVPEMGFDRFNEIMNTNAAEGDFEELGYIGWDFQGLKGELARRMGYDSVGMKDEHGESVLILNGKLTSDAFDPNKNGSVNEPDLSTAFKKIKKSLNDKKLLDRKKGTLDEQTQLAKSEKQGQVKKTTGQALQNTDATQAQHLAALNSTEKEAHSDAKGAALRAVDSLERINGSMLANGMARDYRAKGFTSIVGQKIENPLDLAIAGQIYRNPSFETLRYFFMKGDVVVGQAGVTSRMPSLSSQFSKKNGFIKGYQDVDAEMERLGADGYYLLHNHPTGNPTPSNADIQMSRDYHLNVVGFKGHIVINQHEYSLIDKRGHVNTLPISGLKLDYDVNKPAKDSILLKKEILKPTDLIGVGMELYKPDHFVLVGRSAKGNISGLMEVNDSELNKYSPGRLIVLLRRFMRNTGSADVGIVNYPNKKINIMREAIKNGYLLDAIDKDNISLVNLGIIRGYDRHVDGIQVQEKKSPYNKTDKSDVSENSADTFKHAGYPPRRDYVFIDGSRVTIPSKGQRHEPIMNKLIDIVGRRIYFAKIKNKSTEGFYRNKNGEIRTRTKNDIEILSHEMAHYLDFYSSQKLPDFRKLYRDKAHKFEIEALAYPGAAKAAIKSEGFAEFTRLWLTNESEAQLRAPNFFNEFNKLLRTKPTLYAQMRDLQRMMHRFFFQGPELIMDAYIGENKSIDVRFNNWVNHRDSNIRENMINRFKIVRGIHGDLSAGRQSMLDTWHAARLIEQDLTGKIGQVRNSAWKQFRMADGGSESVAWYVMNHGTIIYDANGDIQRTGISLHDVLAPLNKIKLQPQHKGDNKIDLFFKYMAGKRALELYGRGREHRIPLESAKIRAKLDQTYPEFKKAAFEFHRFESRMMDFYEQAGLITHEGRVMMEELNKDHVSFYRIRDQLGGGPSGFHPIKGGTGNIQDMLLNTQDAISANVKAAMMMRAKQTLYNYIDKSQDGAIFASHIAPDSRKVNVYLEEMEAKIKAVLKQNDVYIMNLDLSTPELLAFWQHGMKPTLNESGNMVDMVMIKGKPRYYEVSDPLLQDMLLAMQPEHYGRIMNIFFWNRNVFTRAVTLGLEFMGVNFARDTTVASVSSIHGFLPVYDTLKGMYSYITQNEAYLTYMRNAGGYASRLHGMTRQGAKARRRIKVDEFGVMTVPEKMLSWFDNVGSAIEYGSRLGESMAATKRGETDADSTWFGREITTDFNAHGSSKFFRGYARTVPFLNAMLVSQDRMYRQLFISKKYDGHAGSLALKSFIGITLPMLTMYLINKDDPAYQAEPDWKRKAYTYVPIGTKENGDTDYFLLPRPYDVGIVFGSIPELFMEYVEKKEGKELAEGLIWSMGQMFGIDGIPQVLNGWYELVTNKKWTGAPVVPRGLEGIDPEEQYTPNTTEIFKMFGKMAHISPIKAEHFYKVHTAYLGGYLLALTENMMWDEKRWGPQPEKDIRENPALRRFFPQRELYSTSFEAEFWDLKDKSDQIIKTKNVAISERRLVKEKVPRNTREIVGDETLSVEEKFVLESLNKSMVKLTRKIYGKEGLEYKKEKIKYNPKLTREEKRSQMDAIQRYENKLYKEFVTKAKQRLNDAKALAEKKENK